MEGLKISLSNSAHLQRTSTLKGAYEITRTLDSIHTVLSYVKGSLQNVTVVKGGKKYQGFIFSLLNPPVPLGGNIISLDVYVDEFPVPKTSVFIATSEDVVNAATLSENRPIPFKPFQCARFLVIKEGGLDKKRHKIVIVSKMEGFEQIMIPFTFMDYAGRQSGEVFVPELPSDDESTTESGENATIFKNFTTPLVLSGKKAYIVCSSNGGLSANWTWMGVRYDNGGLYVPPARAFGRIIVEISMDDGVRKRLPNFVVSSRHENGILQTKHELAGLEVKRKLLVPFDHRGFIMALDLSLLNGFRSLAGRKAKPSRRKIRIHFMINGNITSYGLAAVSQSITSRFNTRHSCLQVSTRSGGVQYFGTIGLAPKSLKPGKVLTDSFDNDLELSYDVEIETGKTVKLALVGTGSFTGQENCLKEYLEMRDSYGQLVEETENGFKEFSSSALNIRSSSSQKQNSAIAKLIAAYEKAKTCLRYLQTEYDGLGEGICAGLPRFPNYWARDTGWTLRGYLAIGDYRFAAATIDNFLKHQAKKSVAGTVKGELPMIISGEAFLHASTYGSADSTFLFPWALKEYVLATGDVAYLKKRWGSIVDLVDWGMHKDVDGDGLVEHGFTGVAEKLPIQDSTWMDHIDRRKSANDIQALFYESLKIGSELAAIVGDSANQDRWSDRAKQLREKIDYEYWNPALGFYYDTIRKDGSKDPSIRPNALVLLLTGAVRDRDKAGSVLERIEMQDMTTPWGVRTLSSLDSRYNPALYHDGAVWPLVTGWAAACEIEFGRKEQSLGYLESMAERIIMENGMFAETYRGDRPEPFNSCILQAWSVGMYVYALREMMLGMKANMVVNRIQFEPSIPESLKGSAVPIEFQHSVDSFGRMRVTVDPQNEKILVALKGTTSKRPEIFSNSYGLSVSYE
jgi:glycogen debranching enzyme